MLFRKKAKAKDETSSHIQSYSHIVIQSSSHPVAILTPIGIFILLLDTARMCVWVDGCMCATWLTFQSQSMR